MLDLEIQSVAYRGSGIARNDGMVVFVPGTLPGERVLATPVRQAKRYVVAEVVEITRPSPDRIAPDCRLADGTRVPGCVYDHAAYGAEVSIKDGQLRDFLRSFAEDGATFLPPFPSPSPHHYRNKSVFHAQTRHGGAIVLGYMDDDNRTVVDIPSCPLSVEAINEELARVRSSARLRGGDDVTIRFTPRDGAVSWVNRPPAEMPPLHAETPFGEIQVPPDGFMQVNTPVASELVSTVMRWAAQSGARRIVDLYCGVGVFALSALASGFDKAVGIESGRSAVAAARENARNIGMRGARFICEDVRESAEKRFHSGDLSDSIVVADPPRSGMDKTVAQALAECGAREIIYVSCDPATLTRDLAVIRQGGYAVREARMLDMFPRTAHFESAVRLVKSQAAVSGD